MWNHIFFSIGFSQPLTQTWLYFESYPLFATNVPIFHESLYLKFCFIVWLLQNHVLPNDIYETGILSAVMFQIHNNQARNMDIFSFYFCDLKPRPSSCVRYHIHTSSVDRAYFFSQTLPNYIGKECILTRFCFTTIKNLADLLNKDFSFTSSTSPLVYHLSYSGLA